jgi:hypothetical protein
MQPLAAIPWFAWIPIIAIVGGVVTATINSVVRLTYEHRERMAMIERGMHPDAAHDATHDPDAKPAAFEEV